jgi:hypothetical protein
MTVVMPLYADLFLNVMQLFWFTHQVKNFLQQEFAQ